MHNQRRVHYILLFLLFLSAAYTAITSTPIVQAENTNKLTLEKVRDYAPAWQRASAAAPYSFAIDGGYLYVGLPNQWQEVPLPAAVIAGAVATDPYHKATIYVGAANEMALYVSRDQGAHWLRVRLDQKHLGGVTDIAVNGAQRTLYVGTDNGGIYRVRDVGSSMILNGHTPLAEPVLEIVSDQLGAGLAFARTAWTVYRGMNNGQQWLALDGFGTTPTALAITNSYPATALIGTTDRGLLRSTDGFTWELLDESMQGEAGTRLNIDALAVDPAQPGVLYVARSYLLGHTVVNRSALGIDMSVDNGITWQRLVAPSHDIYTALLPVSGTTGALYGISTTSRALTPLGKTTTTTVNLDQTGFRFTNQAPRSWLISFSAWLLTALAAVALYQLVWQEWQRQPVMVPVKIGM